MNNDQYSFTKQLVDQSAHAIVAIVILCSYVFLVSNGYYITGGLICGLFLGLIRQITEQGEVTLGALKRSFQGFANLIDLLGWMFGGLIGGIISHYIL